MGILDSDGYIPKFQPQISSLHLCTQHIQGMSTGDHNPLTEHNIDGLMQLQRLTSLRWHGIHNKGHMMILAVCIRQNSKTLERLDLKITNDTQSDLLEAFRGECLWFPRLRLLRLENATISKDVAIAHLKSRSPQLKYITLKVCRS